MIYLASDHAGFELKERIKEVLRSHQMPMVDLVPSNDPKDDYPDISQLLAEKLKGSVEDEDFGIAMCGSGQGICIGLNRYNHIRACISDSPKDIRMCRLHNHVNVMCVPGPYSSKEFSDKQLLEMVETLLHTKPDQEERHIRRVGKLTKLHSSKI